MNKTTICFIWFINYSSIRKKFLEKGDKLTIEDIIPNNAQYPYLQNMINWEIRNKK